MTIGEMERQLVISSDSFLIARVPEGASAGDLVRRSNGKSSESWACDIGVLLAENLHPVSNPAVDNFGNIYTTFSGSRGQKVPVAVYKIDLNLAMKPFIAEMMNATGLAFDDQGMLYISSRHDGFVYQVTPAGSMSVYVEGMGVATGLAFDGQHNLYVGDRSGTIFKIGPDRQIFVFATLEPSMAAYHLAFGPDGYLYVSGPTTSSFDAVHRISEHGEVEVFYRGPRLPARHGFRTRRATSAVASSIGAPARSSAHLPGSPGRAVSLRPRHCRAGLHAIPLHDCSHHQRPPSRGCRHQGQATHLMSGVMDAEIIAVGSELLTEGRLDTNSLYLTAAEMNNLGSRSGHHTRHWRRSWPPGGSRGARHAP